MPDDASDRSLVLAHTVVARPPLVPELSLRLVTEACPLWRATEADLEKLGLPEPFWAFAWPGGQALARHVIDHPELARARRVLDFGSGCAVEAIAAARAGAACVLAADIDPLACEAASLNAALNGVALETTCRDLVGLDEGWDLVLVGDMFYEAALAERLADWLSRLAARGATVLVGDPNRGFFDAARAERLAEYDAPADVDVAGRYRRATAVFRILR
ncbi:MAG TPA: 50S ribosomal protein L11 methyltransferase [Myxococcales bacterium]|jgi:predicted nicotinamide N-methyase